MRRPRRGVEQVRIDRVAPSVGVDHAQVADQRGGAVARASARVDEVGLHVDDRTGRCEHLVGDREVVLGLDRNRVEAAAGDVVERAQHGRGRAPVFGRERPLGDERRGAVQTCRPTAPARTRRTSGAGAESGTITALAPHSFHDVIVSRRWPVGGLEVGADGVRHREHRHLGHAVGDAEHLGRARLVPQVGGGPHRAETTGPEGEHEAPRRGQDRPERGRGGHEAQAVELPLDAGDHEQRDVLDRLRQLQRALVHPPRLTVVLLDCAALEVREAAAAVDLGDRRLLVGVGDDDPAPVLRVRRGGCLFREPDALEDHRRIDGALEIEAAAHRTRRREQLVGDTRVERCVHLGFPQFRGIWLHGVSGSNPGSRGSPSTRSPMMFIWIWVVPPAMVAACAPQSDSTGSWLPASRSSICSWV